MMLIGCVYLERFSIECRKTKTKAITMTNHDKRKQQNEPNTRNRRKAREDACSQVTIGFGFASDWLSQVARVF